MKNWKDLIFEHEPEKPTKPAPEPAPAVPHTATPYPTQVAVPIGTDGTLYQKLASKTNFDDTDIGRLFNKYLKPLAGLPLAEGLKIKTAMAQAAAQEGLTQEKLLATFDGLKAALDAEQVKFTATIDGLKRLEIADRADKIQSISKQIEDLQKQVIELTTQMAQAQGKVDNATAEFHAAVSRRQAELDTQKAHYAANLQT